MRIFSVVLALLLTLQVVAPAAHAYRAGDLEITPTVSLNERYDDNVTSAPNNEIDDFITELALGVTVTGEGKDQKLDLTGAIAHEMYMDNNGYDNTTANLAADYYKELSSRDSVTVREAFTRAEDPTSFADEFGRQAGRSRYYLNRFNLGYTRDITQQFSLTGGYANETYNRSQANQTDSSMNSVDLRGAYSFSSATIASLDYGYANRHYSPGGDANTQTLDAGLRQFLTKQLYMDLVAGYSFIQPVIGKDLVKPRYSATLTDEFDERTKAVLAYTKSFDAGYSSDDVFDSWKLSLDLSHRLYNRLALVAGFFFYGEGKYVRQGIKDKFNGTSLRAEYDVTKNVSAVVNYTRSQTDSTLDTRDYTRNLVSLGLRGKF